MATRPNHARAIRQASVPAATVLPPAPVKASTAPILDAAERVALRDGVGHVTLDAVAKEAGLSKSGLIHHYPSKDALIGALVRRKIESWGNACDAAMDGLLASGESSPGTKGLIQACFECPEGEGGADQSDEDSRRRGCVVVAALVHDAKHINPVRSMHRKIDKRLAADDLPPGVADVIHLALNGLWFNWVFNLNDLTPERMEAIRAALGDIIDRAESQKSTTARAARAARVVPSRKRAAK